MTDLRKKLSEFNLETSKKYFKEVKLFKIRKRNNYIYTVYLYNDSEYTIYGLVGKCRYHEGADDEVLKRIEIKPREEDYIEFNDCENIKSYKLEIYFQDFYVESENLLPDYSDRHCCDDYLSVTSIT